MDENYEPYYVQHDDDPRLPGQLCHLKTCNDRRREEKSMHHSRLMIAIAMRTYNNTLREVSFLNISPSSYQFQPIGHQFRNHHCNSSTSAISHEGSRSYAHLQFCVSQEVSLTDLHVIDFYTHEILHTSAVSHRHFRPSYSNVH